MVKSHTHCLSFTLTISRKTYINKISIEAGQKLNKIHYANKITIMYSRTEGHCKTILKGTQENLGILIYLSNVSPFLIKTCTDLCNHIPAPANHSYFDVRKKIDNVIQKKQLYRLSI